jgi:hypothetical protein
LISLSPKLLDRSWSIVTIFTGDFRTVAL